MVTYILLQKIGVKIILLIKKKLFGRKKNIAKSAQNHYSTKNVNYDLETTTGWTFWVSVIYNCVILSFVKSILKSQVILAKWLAFSGAIYSRIALSSALNRIFFSANETGTVKQNNQSDFKAFLN